ncbi:MAG: LytTR family DNA-binding domain-containing protein [Bacteroidota bacterium]
MSNTANIIKTIIIEDDTSSLVLLKEFLKDFSYVEVIGEAKTIKEAEELVKNNNNPDLLFLDIDLHGVNALDIVKYLKPQTKILFITAHPEFAVKAFEYNTIDYIIKPISFDRLKNALSRVGGIEHDEKAEKETTGRFAIGNMVLMNINGELKFIKIKEINFIEAKGNYTTISMQDGTSFSTYGLIKVWEDKLPIDDFFRIHRSTIVNLNNIAKIEKGTYDTGIMYLNGVSQPFEISRNYFSQMKGKFKLTGNL